MDLLAKHHAILLIVDSSDDSGVAVGIIEQFKAHHPTGRVAVVGERARPTDIVSVFQAGANVYFVSILTCEAFIKALELVMLGETILPRELLPFLESHEAARGGSPSRLGPEDAEDSRTPRGGARLSARERYILRCIVIDGASNKQIARKMNIAEATVKVHVKAILRKIRVQNRTQAAIWAMSSGSKIWATEDGTTSSLREAVLSDGQTEASAPTVRGGSNE
jgi:two-component system nitrate/nitrite response regulator NarL